MQTFTAYDCLLSPLSKIGIIPNFRPAMPMQMKFVPDYKGSSFNPEWLEKSEVKPSGDRIDFHKEFAEDWNQVLHALNKAI